MDETINNFSWWNNTSTTSDSTLTFSYYDDTQWTPYSYEKYTPKWHILRGYEAQMDKMWD